MTKPHGKPPTDGDSPAVLATAVLLSTLRRACSGRLGRTDASTCATLQAAYASWSYASQRDELVERAQEIARLGRELQAQGASLPQDVLARTKAAIRDAVAQAVLSPYDREKVPHLLKVEHPDIPDLRCFAVSAKRYVLYRWRPGRRIEIVKASESALGAIIGRTRNESTQKLGRRVWLSILMEHLDVNPQQRHRAKPLIDFDVPLRRKFPISQPAIFARMKAYNKGRTYDHQVKPFGFVQTVSAAVKIGAREFLPIAPFEPNLAKSKRLAWVDFNTGEPMRLDWHESHMAGTVPVMRLTTYIESYQNHPEAKAADRFGNPAGPETTGLLHRLKLRSKRLLRIGKEVDRLETEEGAALEPVQPIEYERDDLTQDIEYLAEFPRESTARDLGISVRGWWKIINNVSLPRECTAERVRALAAEYRLRE